MALVSFQPEYCANMLPEKKREKADAEKAEVQVLQRWKSCFTELLALQPIDVKMGTVARPA